ncbi:MAG: pilus assembly protein [Anaerolineales bacterium]|nr:pilus assembly protein [Anaerolineales bacterium]
MGQSFVEFAVLLPVLLILFSGLVETGFALNMYLDLVDTAREVARYTSDDNPFPTDPAAPNPKYSETFYFDAAELTNYTLNMAQQVELNPESDDLVVSIFQVKNGVVLSDRIPPIFMDDRLGIDVPNGGELGWRLYGNHQTSFSLADVQQRIDSMGDIPPDAGLVLVEIYYEYDMLLGLPWITMFVENPILLHSYTFAPIPAAKPTN